MIPIRLDIGIRGAVNAQIFTKHPHGYRHHLFRNGKRRRRLVQVNHEPVFVLVNFSFGYIGCGADNLPHAAIRVSRKDLVAAVEPSPDAVAVAHPVFKIGRFFVAHIGQPPEVIQKCIPVVRVHHGGDEFSRFKLRWGVAQRRSSAAAHEHVSTLPDIEDVDQARGNVDDVLYEPLAAFHHFVGQLMLRHVADHFGESARLSCLIAQRNDHTARPEARAIFACLPTLLFTAPCRPRRLQFEPRFATHGILRRIED